MSDERYCFYCDMNDRDPKGHDYEDCPHMHGMKAEKRKQEKRQETLELKFD